MYYIAILPLGLYGDNSVRKSEGYNFVKFGGGLGWVGRPNKKPICRYDNRPYCVTDYVCSK